MSNKALILVCALHLASAGAIANSSRLEVLPGELDSVRSLLISLRYRLLQSSSGQLFNRLLS